ncbi:DUF559 domain-containing protein [Rhodanobacter sp. Root179]|uniref:hypothetical protein n=1 Tax=Rhodanobacter sp. Root179 TaxID=1736482 RepID=UPI0006F75975|nr:hypothetical protein [Rhodanobacter sp. Root179]KRB59370.1 hypothetical protein ASD82_00295 [Rhodanobacter sp. Root179]
MAIKHISETLARLEVIRYAYESPPEESLGERISASLAPGVTFRTQAWVDTAAGPFRLDMLLVHPSGRSIAIEVDGRDFHDVNRDRWRTVFILCAGKAHVVYRIAASLICTNLVGVLAGLANAEPRFFDTTHAARWKGISGDRWEFASAEDDANDMDGEASDDGWSGQDGWWSSSRAFAVSFHGDMDDCSYARVMPYVLFAKQTGLRDIDQLTEAWTGRSREREAARTPSAEGAIGEIFARAFAGDSAEEP